jgi:uncharacterized protein
MDTKSESVKYSPVKQTQRIEIIDALRGFALFGILMVNMLYMFEPMSRAMAGAKPDASAVHIIAESFIKFFFEGKFYVIFSMLFGFGFWLFMNKSMDNNASPLPAFRRRLLFLLLFGLAHVSLLWAGDILILYALIGFLLILFRKASDRRTIRWAVVMVLVPTVLTSILYLFMALASRVPEAKEAIDMQMQGNADVINNLIERATMIYSTGSFGEIVAVRIEEYLTLLSGSLLFFSPVVLAMFLVGFLVARNGLVNRYMENLPLFRRMFWWGLTAGVVTNALYTIAYRNAVLSSPDVWSLLSTSMHTFGGISLGLCYISGIIILFIRGRSGWLVRNLVPVGRMALTNYLMQSVICALLFHSYGFGFYGKVEVWQGIILTVMIFATQILFSRWWLGRFQFGPFEWLWRSLTYRRLQPMRNGNR